MKRALSLVAVLAAFAVTLSAQARATAPSLQVNPLWPQPLPNHWVF